MSSTDSVIFNIDKHNDGVELYLFYFEVKDIYPLKKENKVYKIGMKHTTMTNIFSFYKDIIKIDNNKYNIVSLGIHKDKTITKKVLYKKLSENPRIIKRSIDNMKLIFEAPKNEIKKDMEWIYNYQDNYEEYLKKKEKVVKDISFTNNNIRPKRNTKKVNYKEKSSSSDKKTSSDKKPSSDKLPHEISIKNRNNRSTSSDTPGRIPRKHKDKKQKDIKINKHNYHMKKLEEKRIKK